MHASGAREALGSRLGGPGRAVSRDGRGARKVRFLGSGVLVGRCCCSYVRGEENGG